MCIPYHSELSHAKDSIPPFPVAESQSAYTLRGIHHQPVLLSPSLYFQTTCSTSRLCVVSKNISLLFCPPLIHFVYTSLSCLTTICTHYVYSRMLIPVLLHIIYKTRFKRVELDSVKNVPSAHARVRQVDFAWSTERQCSLLREVVYYSFIDRPVSSVA
jgi:hypothetical protein